MVSAQVVPLRRRSAKAVGGSPAKFTPVHTEALASIVEALSDHLAAWLEDGPWWLELGAYEPPSLFKAARQYVAATAALRDVLTTACTEGPGAYPVDIILLFAQSHVALGLELVRSIAAPTGWPLAARGLVTPLTDGSERDRLARDMLAAGAGRAVVEG